MVVYSGKTPQYITAESLREDIRYDPYTDLEMDHELEELEEPSITTPNPLVTIFSSFNIFNSMIYSLIIQLIHSCKLLF